MNGPNLSVYHFSIIRVIFLSAGAPFLPFVRLLDKNQPLKGRIHAHFKTPSSMSKHFYGGPILSAYRFCRFCLFSSRRPPVFPSINLFICLHLQALCYLPKCTLVYSNFTPNKPLKGVNPVFPSTNLFICLLDRTQPLKRRIYAHLKTPSSMSKQFYGGPILSAY